jgi:hypothetical protein
MRTPKRKCSAKPQCHSSFPQLYQMHPRSTSECFSIFQFPLARPKPANSSPVVHCRQANSIPTLFAHALPIALLPIAQRNANAITRTRSCTLVAIHPQMRRWPARARRGTPSAPCSTLSPTKQLDDDKAASVLYRVIPLIKTCSLFVYFLPLLTTLRNDLPATRFPLTEATLGCRSVKTWPVRFEFVRSSFPFTHRSHCVLPNQYLKGGKQVYALSANKCHFLKS